MFKLDNAPYLFTLIIAMLGWLLTRVVDEATKSPLVAYSVHDFVNAQGAREFTVRVHNIAHATAFRNLYLVLTNLDGVRSKFAYANAQYEAPAHVSEERKTTATWGDTWAGILLKELQPETAVRLATQIEGPDVPLVRCESATDTVRLVKENWQTWAVESETKILFGLALVLMLLLIFYAVYLARTKVPPAVAVASLLLATSGFCSGGTIRVVDDATDRGVQCNIYLEDENTQRHRAGSTDRNGVYSTRERGRMGQKYVAVSEVYNPGSVECPVEQAKIRLHKTVWLTDRLTKADFLNSAGAPAAAALELRKAAVVAEKKRDTELFNKLEFHVAENTAKALGVERPFVETASGLRTSGDLKATVREYQKDKHLKPTGALNTDTIRQLAINEAAEAGTKSRQSATAHGQF